MKPDHNNLHLYGALSVEKATSCDSQENNITGGNNLNKFLGAAKAEGVMERHKERTPEIGN